MRHGDLMVRLDDLVVTTVNESPDTFWRPNDLVGKVKGRLQQVSSADVKGAIWRLAGDRRVRLTADRRVGPA